MSEGVEDYVYKWSISFPLDRWWRKKHNIAFGSPEHRAISFIDQFIEYQEDVLFLRFATMERPKYRPGYGDWLTKRQLSKEEIDVAFDDIDLDNVRA